MRAFDSKGMVGGEVCIVDGIGKEFLRILCSGTTSLRGRRFNIALLIMNVLAYGTRETQSISYLAICLDVISSTDSLTLP